MPIECGAVTRPISEADFYSLDRQVMGIVFGMHNELGALCDERIYQAELAYRCARQGLGSALREVPVKVSHGSFTKVYLVDLLLENSVIYELKATKCLTAKHRKQALNYLLLMGLNYGKLVNMRPPSVEWGFVATRLTSERRHAYSVNDREWEDRDEDSIRLRSMMLDLLSDWGAFLDTDLFYDAIAHFRGGEDEVVQRIAVVCESRVLGTQRAHLLRPDTAFKITAVTRDPLAYERHLRKFLTHTSLRAMQWINLNHHAIAFKSLFR